MRVLVVEDDEKIAGYLAKGLREAGYAIDVAADGEEGPALGKGGRRSISARKKCRCVPFR